MVSSSGGGVGEGAEGGEGNEELDSSSEPPPEEQQVEGAGAGERQAGGDAGVPQDVEGLVSPTMEGEEVEAEPENMPELLNPTREELERAFPNAPMAPYPTLPDPRKFTAEQLASGGNLPVSYGGQPAARRANIDFERSERERIHFETATRVMNYQIQAERHKMASGANAGEVKKMERPDIMEELSRYEEDEFKGVEAIYNWDQTPKLITFSGYGVLYNYHLSVGLHMREALGRAHDYVHRLPGPSFFQKNYQIAHAEASFQIPCFGARENISSWDWWFHVFTEAYLNTINDFFMDEDIVLEKIDDIVDELYYEVMVGPEAFEPVPQIKIVLDRLAAWRDRDGGPKLAVLGNDDERLHVVLENLGLLPYFDFVMTSRETGFEAGDPKMFETALEKAGVEIPRKGLHIGCDYATDISGSCEAGMEACCVKPMQPEYEAPGEPYEYHRLTEVGELLNRLGLPEADQEYLVRRRGKFWEEDDDDEDYEDEFGYGDEVVQAL